MKSLVPQKQKGYQKSKKKVLKAAREGFIQGNSMGLYMHSYEQACESKMIDPECWKENTDSHAYFI